MDPNEIYPRKNFAILGQQEGRAKIAHSGSGTSKQIHARSVPNLESRDKRLKEYTEGYLISRTRRCDTFSFEQESTPHGEDRILCHEPPGDSGS